ncbi:ATP-binding cassette domain-containing protein [Enterococcus sp. LJL98]
MKLEQVGKNIDGKEIIKNVNFILHPNEIVGLIGRNGSGKTTLFRTISGQYTPDHGEISIYGTNLAIDPRQREEIFYIDEKENFLNMYSLKKINQFYQAAYPKFDQDLFIALMKQHQFPINLSYRRMSKGMQGLFQMILAICSNATYLLLDEPFDGLDVIVRKQVIGLLLENLSETNRMALIASHNLNELEGLIDRALIIKGQTIMQDYRLETLRQNARKVQFVFKSKKVPDIVKEHSKVIDIQGRVINALFENYTEALEQEIRSFEPILFEELPLTLEDLFEANLSQESMIGGPNNG